jgi:GAF domain-containing protein
MLDHPRKGGPDPMPLSTRDVHQALAELGKLRFSATRVDDAMHQIVHATHAVFDVDGAGLMMADTDHHLRNAAVSDDRLRHLEDLQVEHHEGPCVSAYEDKELVQSEDLETERRWPVFCPAAVERGLRAVLASPIPYNQEAIGVVVVVSTTRRPWTPEGELALTAFTDLAALLIASMLHGEEQTELSAQLQGALESRVVIEQAKGVYIEREGLTPREAYQRLRSQARSSRRPLTEVAAEVVEATGRRP